jgi:hypothetical protein
MNAESKPLVVLINSGPSAGKIAAIIEIIDHKRVRAAWFYYFGLYGSSSTVGND